MQRLAFCLVLASVLAACAPPTATGGTTAGQGPPQQPARTLVTAIRVEPNSVATKALTPAGGGVATYFSRRMFNADLALLDGDGAFRPYLAEALPQLSTDTWKVFPDGRMETTYRLKPGLVWHDGSPLTSADYVFAFRVFATPDLGAATAVPISLIDQVVDPDPRTIVIHWKRPFPNAGGLQGLGTGSTGLPPLPRALLEPVYAAGQPEVLVSHPYWTREFVGLGPYRLARWEPGAFLEGVAFPQHALGPPKIERITMLVMPDNNATIAGMMAGEVHLAPADANFPLGRVREVTKALTGGVAVLHPNQYRRADFQLRPDYVMHRGLLDLQVRRALAHAIDKAPINEAVYDGQSIPADIMIPPSSQTGRAVDAAITKYPFDLRRSEELMNQAGYTKGGDGFYASPAEGRFVSEIKTNAGTDNVAEMTILASGFRQAGFDVKDAVLPVALAQDREARATFAGMFSANGNIEGAISFTSTISPTAPNRFFLESRGGWNNPEYARLLDAFNGALEPAERLRLQVEMTKIFSDQLPVISLFFNSQPWVFGSSLQGPRPAASESNVSWNIYEWEFQ